MAVVIVYVEAYSEDEGVWKPVSKQLTGEEEDVLPEAKSIEREWLDSGWPRDHVRVSKSVFKEFNKRWRDED